MTPCTNGSPTPSILQRFIPGGEVRVHVVGDAVFAARISSDAVDYRFSDADVGYRAAEVLSEVAGSCVLAAADEGLVLVDSAQGDRVDH